MQAEKKAMSNLAKHLQRLNNASKDLAFSAGQLTLAHSPKDQRQPSPSYCFVPQSLPAIKSPLLLNFCWLEHIPMDFLVLTPQDAQTRAGDRQLVSRNSPNSLLTPIISEFSGIPTNDNNM